MHTRPSKATNVRAISRETLRTRDKTAQKPAPPRAGAKGGNGDELLVRIKGSVTELCYELTMLVNLHSGIVCFPCRVTSVTADGRVMAKQTFTAEPAVVASTPFGREMGVAETVVSGTPAAAEPTMSVPPVSVPAAQLAGVTPWTAR